MTPEERHAHILDLERARKEARAAAYHDAAKIADAYKCECIGECWCSINAGNDIASAIRKRAKE